MVLLGFIDEPKGNKPGGDDDDPKNWTISRIGGEPAFPNEDIAEKLKTVLICSKCQKEQIFVCQLYCPLEGHKYDRALYLFACRNPSCWNASESWRAIRCQNYDDIVVESTPIDDEPVPNSSTDWCDEADAWNSDDNDDNSNTFVQTKTISTIKKESEVQMLNSMTIEDKTDECKSSDEDDEIEIDSKTKTKSKNVSIASLDAFDAWKKSHLLKPTIDLSQNGKFPFYYIVIDDEDSIVNEAKIIEEKKLKNKVKKLEDIDENDDYDDETSKGGKEKYEKTPDIEHGDVVFYKFQQKIRYAPDQIIRYDWSGNPLILTKLNGNSLSSMKCPSCQSSSVFEFQLMPALVNFLKIDNQIGLEFGTVFVYTCSKNCWDENKDLYRLENVFLQTDPDQNLFD